MRHPLIILLALLFPTGAMAQSLTWEKERLATTISPDDTASSVEFHFKNGADHPVLVKQVVASCSCVKASTEPRSYAPGESGLISLTATRKGRPRVRAIRVYVMTDEAGIRPYELRLEVTETPQNLPSKRSPAINVAPH